MAALRIVGMLKTVHMLIRRELVESGMLAHASTLGADRRILSSGPVWTTQRSPQSQHKGILAPKKKRKGGRK